MTSPYQYKQNVPHEEPGFPFCVFHIVPPEKQILHLHWHEDFEIIYFVKGNAVFHIGSETIRPEPGDLLFVNKGLIHTGFSEDDSQVEYHAIVFHSSLVGSSMADAYHMQITNPYVNEQCFFPRHISRKSIHYPYIISTVNQMIAEYEQQCRGFQLAIRSMLHLLLVHLSRHHQVQDQSAYVTPFDVELAENFKELISFVELHYMEKLTVQQAASIVNLSESHFCRTFKKMTGKTFVEYVNLHRINAAEQLLIHTNDTVTEIGFKVSFSSINYFNQMFKQYKRCSPSQCRKKYMANNNRVLEFPN